MCLNYLDNNKFINMNKTFARLFVVVIAVVLVTSQFWSCSTAQSITFVHTQVQNDVEPTGEAVLLFKLLTPMMPEDGQQITKTSITEGHQSSQEWHWSAIPSYPRFAYLIPIQYVQNVSPYSFKENKAYTQCCVFSTPSRGPPCYTLS